MSGPTPSAGAGIAKWAAIFLLGSAAGGGLVYSIVTRPPAPAAAAQPAPPAPQPPAPQPIVVQIVAPPAAPAAASATPPETAPPASSPAQPQTQPPAPAEPATPQPLVTAPPASPPPAAPPTSPTSPTPSKAVAHKININTASQSELELLPQVGPALASRIIEYRTTHGPFRQPQELDKVKGIGEKTLAKLLPLITVEEEKKPR